MPTPRRQDFRCRSNPPSFSFCHLRSCRHDSSPAFDPLCPSWQRSVPSATFRIRPPIIR
jgi:hypothetical protein